MNDWGTIDRRTFLSRVAMAGAGLAVSNGVLGTETAARTKLGFDTFSVRALKWKAPQLVDYAAQLKLDVLFVTDLDLFESLEESYLTELRKKAGDVGVDILAGTWSICPSSKVFKSKWGTAEEHLAVGIRVAKAVGSPILRCVLGMGQDRDTPGGIEARIADTVKVCKACRSRALDAGVKIAIENHGGDMQARELVGLIEEAGKEYVGATIDPGNAAWTMEDPLQNLEVLAPYVVASHLRDSMVWETPVGATVQWTAMGEGNVDFKTYMRRFTELCPGVAACVEAISGFPREVRYLKEDFWKVWPKARGQDLARFIALAKTGKAIPSHRSADEKTEQAYQKGELERSLKYCKEVLGLGLKGA